ncbi:MAG: T9SS type A sorting domain-containing protein [Candidatus Cloacimonetes bacterium]|nr:T9SS type A sorting domain-containing protein [Candidatus Cloacimonadota bacterium]
MRKLFFLLMIVILPLATFARIYYVDDDGGQDFTSIQAGFDDPGVEDGDTLYVYPGTNYGPLVIGNRGLYVSSYQATGIEISDDGNDTHCIKFTSSCIEPTYFIGFAIVGGDAQNGGGIYASDVTRTIHFDKCVIKDNAASSGNGGGLYIEGTSNNICTIVLSNTIINDNSAYYNGGGFYGEQSNLEMHTVEFYDNSANKGGALYSYGLWAVNVDNILFYGNQGYSNGGAVYMAGDSSIYPHEDFDWNKVTIANNESTNGIGGIYIEDQDYSELDIVNSIVWNNEGAYQLPDDLGVTYSCVDANTVYPGTENINEAPEFVNTASDDYSLEYWSPCIDKGNRSSTYDDGDGSMADMGYKYHEQYEFIWSTGGISDAHWKWLSYPLLPLDHDDYYENGGEYANAETVRWHWNNIPDSIAWYDESSASIWFYGLDTDSDEYYEYWSSGDPGTDSLLSVKGYKLCRNESGCLPFTRGLPCKYDTYVSTYQNFDSWLGYFINQTQSAEDAIPSAVLDDCVKIQTQRWSTSRATTNDPWSKDPDYCYLNYTDLVVMKTMRARSFQWNDPTRDITEPIIRPYATHFTWEEEIDYLPIYVEFDPEDVPNEIAVYVDGECRGAEVVDDLICQICSYILFEEPGQEIEFEFWYEGRGSVERKGNYQIHENGYPVTSNTLFTGQPGEFYTLSFNREEDIESVPYELCCYPNPFNPELTVAFSLDKEAEIELTIYNVKGQLIRTLVNETFRPQDYNIIWNGDNNNGNKVSSGVYFVRLQVDNDIQTNKVILMK